MDITCWGTRGSIPTPGKNLEKYGGNTTCFEITTSLGNTIIIDAGSGIRNLGNNILKSSKIKEIILLLTHAHWDHLMGFPFFTPAYLSEYKIDIYGGDYSNQTLETFLRHQMEHPYFPVDYNMLKAELNFKNSEEDLLLNDTIEINSIQLNHPDGGVGYKFSENGKSLTFITDNELDFQHKNGPTVDDFISFCSNSDVLFHDAQYNNREYTKTIGWGHSTFQSAVNLAIKANVKVLGFCHHDPNRTDKQLDIIVERYNDELKKRGKKLRVFAVKEKTKYNI